MKPTTCRKKDFFGCPTNSARLYNYCKAWEQINMEAQFLSPGAAVAHSGTAGLFFVFLRLCYYCSRNNPTPSPCRAINMCHCHFHAATALLVYSICESILLLCHIYNTDCAIHILVQMVEPGASYARGYLLKWTFSLQTE